MACAFCEDPGDFPFDPEWDAELCPACALAQEPEPIGPRLPGESAEDHILREVFS